MSQVKCVKEAQSLENVLDVNVRVKTFLPVLSQAIAMQLDESQRPKTWVGWFVLISNIRKQSIQHQTLMNPPYSLTNLVILPYLLQTLFLFFSKDTLQVMHALHPKGIHSLSLWI